MDNLSELEYLRRRVTELEQECARLRSRDDDGLHLYLHRVIDTGSAIRYHLTDDGTNSVCQSLVNPSNFEVIELSSVPDDLCGSCYRFLERRTCSARQNNGDAEGHNAIALAYVPDTNPLFQTHVYVFRSEETDDYKVGISINPRRRLVTLRHAGGRVLRVVFVSAPCTDEGARLAELRVRERYGGARVAHEWYRLSVPEADRVCRMVRSIVAQDRHRNIHTNV